MSVSTSQQFRALGLRPLIAVTVALFVAGGSIFGLNTTALPAAILAVAAALAALGPLRSARIIGYLAAALLGLLLAIASLLSKDPAFIALPAIVVTALALWYAGWREAVSASARWWHRSTAALISAAMFVVLFRVLAQIGAEGGYCWLPGLPIGCLP